MDKGFTELWQGIISYLREPYSKMCCLKSRSLETWRPNDLTAVSVNNEFNYTQLRFLFAWWEQYCFRLLLFHILKSTRQKEDFELHFKWPSMFFQVMHFQTCLKIKYPLTITFSVQYVCPPSYSVFPFLSGSRWRCEMNVSQWRAARLAANLMHILVNQNFLLSNFQFISTASV